MVGDVASVVAVGLVDPVAVCGRAGRAGSVADAVGRVYFTARTRCVSAGFRSSLSAQL
jgi:hypothetical protein